jgi:hypothetical protein
LQPPPPPPSRPSHSAPVPIFEVKILEKYEKFVQLQTPAEYNAMKVSIRENGQHLPGVVNQHGVIIDGHHRYRACNELGIPFRYDIRHFDSEQFKLLMSNYEKGIDPIPYVKAGLEKIDKGELSAEDLAIKVKLSTDAEEYDPKTAMGKIARAYNGKRNDVVSYYLTGTKGNA